MADTLDVITLAEGRRAINLADSVTTLDTELAMLITGVSRRIDQRCGPVVARAMTERHNGGCTTIQLRNTPVSSITSVTEWDTAGTSTALTAETDSTKPASGYLLANDNGHYATITRRAGGASTLFTSGKRNVIVVASVGRAANTAAVDALFKLAAANVLRRLWQREAPIWAQTPDFGADVADVGFFRVIDPMINEWLGGELVSNVLVA